MKTLESKKRSMKNINCELPHHIIPVIFSKLRISDFPVCRTVCRAWNDLILDYSLSSKFLRPNSFLVCTSDRINMNSNNNHTSTGLINPKMHCVDNDTKNCVASIMIGHDCSRIRIINSCNGLIFVIKDGCCAGILNLMTNEFFQLETTIVNLNFFFSKFGFGFSPKTKQYKLFKFTWSRTKLSSMEVFTFGSSGTNKWRQHHCLPFTINSNVSYLNGVIYWMGEEGNKFLIYALDVETEQIESIATLDLSEVGSFAMHVQIQTFNSTIYALVFTLRKVHVWRMQHKYSWIKEFVIDQISYDRYNLFHLIKAFEDGRILILSDGCLFYFDKTTERKTKTKILVMDSDKIELTSVCCMSEYLNFESLSALLT